MRVIGGRLRGRTLTPPADRRIRPSKDRVREALFNILESRFGDRLRDGRIADLFAGTGALGIEALSRGAAHAVFVDADGAAVATIRRNLDSLGLAGDATVIQTDAVESRLPGPFDIVFIDPPYDAGAAVPAATRLAQSASLSAGGVLVLETADREAAPEIDGFHPVLDRRYGKTRIAFYTGIP